MQTFEYENFDDTLARLGIPESADYVIFGDGSGSTFDRPCGWGSVCVDMKTGKGELWYGAANRGTVNIAEINAYLIPLTWLVQNEQRRVQGGGGFRLLEIHIITDSEYCKKMASSEIDFEGDIKNKLFWTMFMTLKQDVNCHWHHVGRESVVGNVLADRLSKLSRKLIQNSNTQAQLDEDFLIGCGVIPPRSDNEHSDGNRDHQTN